MVGSINPDAVKRAGAVAAEASGEVARMIKGGAHPFTIDASIIGALSDARRLVKMLEDLYEQRRV